MAVVLFHSTTAEKAASILRNTEDRGPGQSEQGSGDIWLAERPFNPSGRPTGDEILAADISDISLIKEFERGDRDRFGRRWLVPMARLRELAALRRATVDDVVRALPGEPIVLTGNVVEIDGRTLKVDSGASFALHPSFNRSGLKAGDRVTVIEDLRADGQPPSRSRLRRLFAIVLHREGADAFVIGSPSEEQEKREQRRAGQIQRFTDKQRYRRRFINLAEIAEWCAREDHSIVPSNTKREAAFKTLTDDLLAGEFEENGRSLVLYLNASVPPARMTPEWLKDARDHDFDGERGRSYLARCWIPWRLFDRWLLKHRLPESPPAFFPAKPKPPRLVKPERGRPQVYNWVGVKSRLAAYAADNGPVTDLNELLQKCSDFATDLHRKHKTPADKTIRDAIKTHSLDIAASRIPKSRGKSG